VICWRSKRAYEPGERKITGNICNRLPRDLLKTSTHQIAHLRNRNHLPW